MRNKMKIKYVYHEFLDENNIRRYSRFSNGKQIYLDKEFPYLRYLGYINLENPVAVIRNITFDYGLDNGKAWIDKHGNVIVRIDNPYRQTKIDF